MLIFTYLALTITFIIFATAKYKIHPFLTLIIASLGMGLVGGLETEIIIKILSEGFGNTLKSIGIVIACGSIIGTYLEKTGSAKSIAGSLLKMTGSEKSPLAMNLTGFFVSIPVFCDSGYVILSTLNKAINKKTGISLAVLGTALAAGLYATHVFVPPTPGPLAAASILGANIGRVLIYGFIVAVPVSLVGWFWSIYYCSRFSINSDLMEEEEKDEIGQLPDIFTALLPIIVPIFLITIKSVIDHPSIVLQNNAFEKIISFIGHPIIAILFGVFMAMISMRNLSKEQHFNWVADGLKAAVTIILITGAGGAFGNILRATSISDVINQGLIDFEIGLLLPFFIAALLKTAQGSSTVSIITTAAMIAPLLDALGLSSEMGKVLSVLAIGAGAMTVSHLNDSYFWVVSQFSKMSTNVALRSHTVATLLQGITAILLIQVLSLLLL